MTLETTAFFDNRNNIGAREGLHALLIGISHYPNIEAMPQSNRQGNRPPLTCAALSALRMYRWLLQADQQGILPIGLASARLLIAPSPLELKRMPRMAGLAEPGGLTEKVLVREIIAWRNRCNFGGVQEDPTTNCSLVYYAGHGMHQPANSDRWFPDDYLVPSNVEILPAGEGLTGPLISISSLITAMGPRKTEPRPGRQIFIFDCCREYASDNLNVHPIPYSKAPVIEDHRSVATYRAVLPGDLAYGRTGRPTHMNAHLIRCLNGLGAADSEEPIPGGNIPPWRVTVHSLQSSLDHYLRRPGEGSVLDGPAANDVLVKLPAPPHGKVRVELEASQSIRDKAFLHFDHYLTPYRSIGPGVPSPYEGRMHCGSYTCTGEEPSLSLSSKVYYRLGPVRPISFKLSLGAGISLSSGTSGSNGTSSPYAHGDSVEGVEPERSVRP